MGLKKNKSSNIVACNSYILNGAHNCATQEATIKKLLKLGVRKLL